MCSLGWDKTYQHTPQQRKAMEDITAKDWVDVKDIDKLPPSPAPEDDQK